LINSVAYTLTSKDRQNISLFKNMNVVSKSFNGAKIPQQLPTPLSINQSRISSDKHKNLSLMKGASHSFLATHLFPNLQSNYKSPA
jgi:hypothetical protein